MTGTTAKSSLEPPTPKERNRHRHTEKTSVEKNPTSLGGGREGKKMADRTQHEGKTERAKESHDRCSQPPGMRMPKTTDLGTQALLVVNSFKLHSNASVTVLFTEETPNSVKTWLVFVRSRSSWNLSRPLVRWENWRSWRKPSRRKGEICHFHISRNAPYLPRPKFRITFVFHFFWVLQLSQEKLKTMLRQNFGDK